MAMVRIRPAAGEKDRAALAPLTLDGRTLVCESNKVCLYAPRFAAVRQVRSSLANDGWDNIAGSNHDLKLNLHEERLAANTKVKQVQPLGDVGLKGPTALLEKLPPQRRDYSRLPISVFLSPTSAVRPPSTGSVTPVMKEASSDARKAIAAATSS